jgi:hypothetical protein
VSAVVRYADVETLMKEWTATTGVAPLVARTGGFNIYLAMPASSPMPAVVIDRVGGGPSPRSDLPQEVSRISFACWGNSRAQAGEIARMLVGELETLARTGGWIQDDVLLAAGEVLSVIWLPDPDSDKPRYIVDALVTTVCA